MNKTSSAIVRTLLLGTSCLSIFAVDTARAQPAGGTVALGTATITNNGSNSTVIDQKTGRLVINWNSFSIDAGGTVKFNQPGSSSIALNRILGADPTQIYGSLLANGQVWIINGNGVLFGQGSRINVGGLIATTADLDDSDFAAGNYDFSGGTGASVANQGSIKTRRGGYAVLSGASASNQGLIAADAGSVAIGGSSAFTVDFDGDGLLKYSVSAPTGRATSGPTGASNSGTITAQRVVMTARAAADVRDAVVNNTGMISASSARVQDGEVILDGGDGDVNVGGTISATGTASGASGGSVTVTGHNITVADNTQIDVSGNAGGGTVRIGGDLHGTGSLPNAANVTVGNATIKADATSHGNGGTVVVWSDGTTDFGGTISARGAGAGGNGGMVETSGHNLDVAPQASVDTRAASGATGTWLLDPDYITIGTSQDVRADSSELSSSGDAGNTQTVTPSTLENSLATTTVTLDAKFDINVISNVTYNSANALNLLAGGDINVAANVQNAGAGAITLVAGWNGITLDPAHFADAGVYGNDGTVTIGGDIAKGSVSVGSQSGATTVLTGDLDLSAVNGAAQLGYGGGGGTGAITVLATGDVTLTASANTHCGGCSAQIGNGGVFANGNNSGDISVTAQGDVTLTAGAEDYSFAQIGNGGDSSTGNDSGTVFVSARDSVTVNSSEDYAQIGNGGWGVAGVASGNVTVLAANDIVLTGDPDGGYGSVQIGNGGQRASGSFSGNITVSAGGNLTLTGGGVPDFVQIGNGAADGSAGSGSSTGDATGDISVTVGGEAASYSDHGAAVWLGNFAASDGTESGNVVLVAGSGAGDVDFTPNLLADLQGGDFTYGLTGGGDNEVGNLLYNSAHNLTLLSSGDLTIDDSITNDGTGAITLVAGWDGTTLDPTALRTMPNAFGNNEGTVTIGGEDAGGDVRVGSNGGTLTVLTDNLDVDALFGKAQLGYHGAGGGDITVTALNDIDLFGGSFGGTYFGAFIGNGGGSVTGAVTGNITLTAGGSLILETVPPSCSDCSDGASAFIGNRNVANSGPVSGNVVLIAGDFNDGNDYTGGLGDSVTADLANGDVTLGETDSASVARLQDGFIYDSSHNLTVLSAGDIDIQSDIENSGSGAITLVAGWDGHTLDAAHFGDAGVYGNDGGSLTVGGASAAGNSSVGSSGGATNVYADDVTLSAINGTAQIGCFGTGSGAITIDGLGTITLDGGADMAHFAQIGSGAVFGANTTAGDVALTGGSIDADGFASVVANSLTLTANSGGIGNSDAPLQIAVNALTVQTSGGSAYLTSPQSVAITSADMATGDFTLSAGGAITQTGTITSGSLNVSTTSGAITLTNAANAFGPLTVSTTGSDNASFAHSSLLTVASANVGGTLTLTAGTGVNQSGAIHAAALNATATDGTIVLTNAGNSFASLTLSTTGSNDASVTDASAVTLGASTVGGTLTLAAGGAIGQSGALSSAGLNVSTTTGVITLTNSANAFGPLTVSTTGSDDASFTSAGSLAVASAHVGGTLTLAAGGAITQTGALTSGALDVSTTSGAITLSNSANAFGPLTVSTTGSDNASFANAGAVTVASANVGGTLTLAAGGAITQTGAVTSGGLNVSTTSGAITLTNAANAFGPLTVSTQGSDDASFTDTGLITVASADVGGTLTLTGSAIGQTGAIQAAALNATATTGSIALGNAGNSFAALTLSTTGSNNANVTDATAVALNASTVGGALTIVAGGQVGQTGALTSGGLNVTTSAGGIALNNAANAVSGVVHFNTPGAAIFADTLDTTVGGATVGGDFTLLSEGNVVFIGGVQSTTGAITVVAGWDGTTTDSTDFGNSGVYGNGGGAVTLNGVNNPVGVGSQSGATTVYASALNILGTNAPAQLGYHGAGGGAITVRLLHDLTLTAGAGNAFLGNGSIGDSVTGNITGDIDVRIGGDILFTDSETGTAWIGNIAHSGTESGNLILVMTDTDGVHDRLGDIVTSEIGGGDVTLGFIGTEDQGPDKNYAINSSHTLNLLTMGNLVIAGSLQNAGSGAINLVAGWDGHTLTPASFGNAGVFGNGGKGVVIGGASASGGVAIGSADGQASVYGASLALTATNGYAQLGFNGHGSGGVLVDTTGAVTLTGGANAGDFAQIGNGGLKTSGDNSGDISIDAGGDVVLAGGAGTEAYAQIGHGGAESNTAANGYSNSGAIGITAADLTMTGGTGQASYVEIGQGGYKSGLDLAGGQAVNGGAITVNVLHDVTLNGGGDDAFAQIGSGGSQSNLDAAAAAGGTDSGDIVVSAPNGPGGSVTSTAGGGANAYAQIGNGGYAVNSGPTTTVANFTVSGNITVTDLTLTGGPGANGFSQIGNGDASLNSDGNISGNILIDANGDITFASGSGLGSQAAIGNFTGQGTVSGTIEGVTTPSEFGNDPGTIGVVVTNTANNNANGYNPITTINSVVVTGQEPEGGAATLSAHIEDNTPPGPLASLDDRNAASVSPNASDSATVVIADSLDGAKKQAATQTILAGMLTQAAPTGGANSVHAIPPADQDFSSWGNEALWQ